VYRGPAGGVRFGAIASRSARVPAGLGSKGGGRSDLGIRRAREPGACRSAVMAGAGPALADLGHRAGQAGPGAGGRGAPRGRAEPGSSCKRGGTGMSRCRRTAGTWTCGTNPVTCTRLPDRCARRCSAGRSGPPPTTSSCAPAGSRANASGSVPASLCGASRLGATLDELRIPKPEQDELVELLRPMRDDIVEVESPQTGTPLPDSYQAAPPLT